MAKKNGKQQIDDSLLKVVEDLMGPLPEDDKMLSAHLREDLTMDSLDIMELSMALEESCEITIEDEEAAAWQTLGDVQSFLKKKGVTA